MENNNFNMKILGMPQYFIYVVAKRDNNQKHITPYYKLFYVEYYLKKSFR